MKVLFRVDASDKIGSGHVMRCLCLAEELKHRGSDIVFFCRQLKGNLIGSIEKRGYKVYRLSCATSSVEPTGPYADWLGANWETDASEVITSLQNEGGHVDWLIVDHYALDKRWEEMVRFGQKTMVIDDLANRKHICNLLLDQNLYESMETRYNKLVPSYCQQLLGAEYALLRDEFGKSRQNAPNRSGNIDRILVFFGGSDLTNETSKTLEAIAMLDRSDVGVDVVIGVNNPYRSEIESLASSMSRASCNFNVTNMAELMLAADIYIGAAGTTLWERCCVGLPSLVVTVTENQVAPIEYLSEKGVLHYIGKCDDVNSSDIKEVLLDAISHPETVRHYSQAGYNLVDGAGAKRCADIMLS